jgi:hypothetical protein
LNDCNDVKDKVAVVETKNTTNYVDDLIGDPKLPTPVDNERVDFEKGSEDLDSEEETGWYCALPSVREKIDEFCLA